MKLPDLENFDFYQEVEDLTEKEKKVEKKVKNETKKNVEKNERPKLPKSRYGENGVPILTVPDIDAIDLKKELDRFFE